MANQRIPKLSRATFCLIASILKNADICTADRSTLTADFTSALYATNPNFKPERFRDACTPNGGSVVRHG